MNKSQDTSDTPWWETELPIIRQEQSAYLRRRLPALRADHDDLINDSLFALTREIRRPESLFPASWFENEGPKDEAERSRLHKLAMLILRRRIADLFRKRASRQNLFVDDQKELVDPNAPSPEHKITLAQMLQAMWSVLDEMKPEDRDLVALIYEDAELGKSLGPRERQRLHRIRKRLKHEISRRLGVEAVDLLRTTP